MIKKIIGNLQRNGLMDTAAKSVTYVGNRLRLMALRRRNEEFVPSRYGVLMKANWQDFTFRACINGSYGNKLSDHLAGRREKFAFVDIGANQGLYSLIAGKNPNCTTVLAFEPVAATAALLRANIARNGLSDKGIVVQKAVSDAPGTATISMDDSHSGAATLREGVQSASTIEIQLADIVELDSYLPDGVAIHIKIDVEGHEETVIEQIVKSKHAEQIESIFYEIDERWVNPARIAEMLSGIGLVNIEQVGSGKHYDVMASR